MCKFQNKFKIVQKYFYEIKIIKNQVTMIIIYILDKYRWSKAEKWG